MTMPEQSNAPLSLNQLQHWFQSVITHSEGVEAGCAAAEAQQLIGLQPGELEKVITRSKSMSAAERLAVYANAYHTRLLECLGEVYPMLKRTLGEEGFNSLAFAYLQDFPSRSYTLNELGRHFPQFLQQTRPVEDNEQDPNAGELDPAWPDFLIDLAKLEWSIYDVFDGEGVEGKALLSAEQVLSISPERWAQARLKPVVCLRLLATRFEVNDYFSALRRAGADECIPMPAATPSFVALTRRNFVVRRYNLSAPEFELLKACQSGQTIGEALQAVLATDLDTTKLARTLELWFRNWTAEGFFESVTLGTKADGE